MLTSLHQSGLVQLLEVMNMYGRQGVSSYNISSYNSNNNNSNSNNNSYNNNFNSSYNRNEERLGSYRGDYKYEEPPTYLTAIISNWKSYPPLSIVTREEFLHLTVTQLRVEDYFMMRTKKLRPTHEDKMRDAIRKEAYNQELNRINCYNLMPFSRESSLNMDAIKSMTRTNDSTTYGNNSNNSNNSNNIYNSRNSNIFGGNGNSYNSSSNNNSGGYGNNNNSSNIFSRNSNTGSNSYNNNSNNSNNNNSGNIFSSNNNSSNSNIFNRNSNTGNSSYNNNYNSSGNNNNNSSGGNIFNRGSSNSGSNIFSNNNNNSGGNIFNNGNNSNNSGNIFSNNGGNNSGSNIFGNNNASNNNGRSNIFNNNNNNGSNNIFGNNYNNGRGNIFNNGNNGNGIFNNNNGMYNNNNQDSNMISMGVDPRFFTELHSYMKSMNEIVKKMNGLTSEDERSSNNSNNNSNSLFPAYDNSYLDLYQNQLRTKKKRQEENSDFVILIPQAVSRSSSRISQYEEGEGMEHNEEFNRSMKHTRTINNYSHVRQEAKRNSEISKTQFLNNTKNPVLTNTFKAKSAYREERIEQIAEDQDCECKVSISIFWADAKSFKSHKLPSEINATVQVAGFRPENEAWKEQLLNQLNNPLIRRNAVLKINSSSVTRKGQKLQAQLTGVLTQKIVNNKTDKCIWQRLENGLLFGLTLQNKCGKVTWKDPVKVQHLDFSYFEIHQNEIEAFPDTPLNCKCLVEFYKVPEEIKKIIGQDKQKAWEKMSNAVAQQGEGKFKLISLDYESWKMEVQQFP